MDNIFGVSSTHTQIEIVIHVFGRESRFSVKSFLPPTSQVSSIANLIQMHIEERTSNPRMFAINENHLLSKIKNFFRSVGITE